MQKKIIPLSGVVALILTIPLAVAEPPLLNLNDFAYGADLTSAESEFRRFTLSPVMIKDIQRRDLGDIRVFDGNNELMPTLVRKKGGLIKTSQQTLTFYPDVASGITSGYILDRTANHEQSLKSLHLQWKQGAAPKILFVRVEHSDDKKSWSTLIDSETVNNINFSGITLKQNIIDINDYTQRYIKLSFQDTKQTPALASVKAYVTNKKLPDDSWVSVGKLQPHENISNSYRFSVSAGISPNLIKLSFGKLNTVLSGSLHTIAMVNGKLQQKSVVDNFDAYVITLNNKVVKSKPIDVSEWQSSQWLITSNTANKFAVNDLPGVMVSYPQHDIIFANDGDEPYTVVWGNSTAGAPKSGDIAKRIKANALTLKDIATVTPGNILNTTGLTELMESRQQPWLMLLIGLFSIITVIASIFGYKRYQSSQR